MIAKTGAALAETGVTEAVSFLTDLPVPQRDLYWKLRQSVEVTDATAYRFDRLKSKKDTPEPRLTDMHLAVPSALEDPKLSRAIVEGQAIARAVRLAKDLANSPSNHCTPAHLAAEAKAIQKVHPAVKVRVLDGAQMKRLGMGALLGVARGSHEPPLLITLEYRGTRASAPPADLRFGGDLHQTGRGHGRDEVRHGGCGERARDAPGRGRAEVDPERRGHHPRHREHARRQRHQTR